MHKILLTGASGFLGRHCLEVLASQFEVHAVSRSLRTPAAPNIHWHHIDLFRNESVAELLRQVRPSRLLHLAWVTDPATYRDSPENLDWLAASMHLLRAFSENGGQRVVMAGSCAEYDWSSGVCDEATTPLRPANLYGICKNALREVLEAYARQNGLSAAWGRVFFLYGPGEHPDRLVSYVIRSLLAGQPAQCSAGSQRRDYMYVEDAARAFLELLNNPCTGAFNIGTGSAVSIREICEAIEALLGTKDLLHFDKPGSASTEVAFLVADSKRGERQLAWRPRVTLKDGLARMAEYWGPGVRGFKTSGTSVQLDCKST